MSRILIVLLVYIPDAGHTQCRSYPMPDIPNAGHTQCRTYPMPDIPNAGHTQCRTYPMPEADIETEYTFI